MFKKLLNLKSNPPKVDLTPRVAELEKDMERLVILIGNHLGDPFKTEALRIAEKQK